jgi:glycosyltransferase involved in cell wall biosynthesis
MNSENQNISLKVALVHDWLTGMRGGEKVLEIFCELFPEAPIYTLLYNSGSVSQKIAAHDIHTAFIDRLPLKRTKYRHYLPLFPTAIEQFDFKGYDLILSTSHCVAKGIITPPDALHISYVHTPMRYVWDMYHEYFEKGRVGWFGRLIIPYFANYLRSWDVSSSPRVDWYVANSRHVANRIKKYYHRDAEVIHPPVDTDRFSVTHKSGDYYLVVSALAPYKKIDLAIEAFNRMKKKLIVIGNGPEEKKLHRMAGPTIEFLDWQPHEELSAYYSECTALIFPGEEDFGIVPVEAMACGKPVIAFNKGGALETIIGSSKNSPDKGTGLFFPEQTSDSLIEAVGAFEQISWDPDFISNHAKKFDRKSFTEKIQKFIQGKISEFMK